MNATPLETIEREPEGQARFSVIWLHGLGADGHDFHPIPPSLGVEHLGVRFVFPHAPHRPVTINGGFQMRAWYDIYGIDDRSKQDDAGIRDSSQLIEALITREHDRGIPAQNIILAGFSQGGAMALHMGIRRKTPFAGVICLSAYLPLAPLAKIECSASARQTPIFMAHGEMDPMVPIHLGQQSREALQQLGFEPQWHSYPMEHSVHPREIEDIGKFLRAILN